MNNDEYTTTVTIDVDLDDHPEAKPSDTIKHKVNLSDGPHVMTLRIDSIENIPVANIKRISATLLDLTAA